MALASTRFKSVVQWIFLLGNGALLYANLTLFGFQLTRWWIPLHKSQAEIRRFEVSIEEDAYCVREPFAVTVGKHFPTDNTFSFVQLGEPFVFTGQPNPRGGNTVLQEVSVGIGFDFLFSCIYSRTTDMRSGGAKLHEIRLRCDDNLFLDFNADGFFDYRSVRDAKQKTTAYVYYSGRWQAAVSGDNKSIREASYVVADEVLVWDPESGGWQPKGTTDAKSHDTTGAVH